MVGGGPHNVSVDETGHQAVLLKVFPYGVQMIVAHVEQVQEGMQTDPPMCVKNPLIPLFFLYVVFCVFDNVVSACFIL